ncbi:Epimerase KguE [Castellaniella defragrans 65Phen]|jgi:sugar phosphate isomerase/epimerase|uniref:Epimerase KguE n=2 Tax=Castellaniella defragrans TaxID=75697 RepID=W8X8Q8_CASD6|nr:TIM barrel protein [Castellaniella defragrans]MBB6084423.1 sugar phosphate isomerase/epimerase [Castellaniella defragrans]CDM23500.1 Epimerase KguE [Castellaniella defragrans 65Phen]
MHMQIPARGALVSLTAFGADEVRRHGQAWFARLARTAGADGIEVRGELLREDAAGELDALAALAAEAGLARVYSSPRGIWDASGRLDEAAVREGLERAARLGAAWLKMSIGGFAPHAPAGLDSLRILLAGAPVELLVENDQTESAGTVPALRAFFRAADDAGLPLGMTFDMGNWHWVGECPLRAAGVFGSRVRYVHCKGALRRPDRWVAVPLESSAAPWRAVLRALPAAAPRAIEYPLTGADLARITGQALDALRRLEQSSHDND